MKYSIVITAVLCATSIVASTPFETTPKASKDMEAARLELRNKEGANINVIITDKTGLVLSPFTFKGEKTKSEADVPVMRLKAINTNNPVFIYITLSDKENIQSNIDTRNPNTIIKGMYEEVAGKNKRRKNNVKGFEITPDRKTLFLTYEKGTLRPQSGSLGKTQSGLPLKNNVKSGNIKTIKNEQIQEDFEHYFPELLKSPTKK